MTNQPALTDKVQGLPISEPMDYKVLDFFCNRVYPVNFTRLIFYPQIVIYILEHPYNKIGCNRAAVVRVMLKNLVLQPSNLDSPLRVPIHTKPALSCSRPETKDCGKPSLVERVLTDWEKVMPAEKSRSKMRQGIGLLATVFSARCPSLTGIVLVICSKIVI